MNISYILSYIYDMMNSNTVVANNNSPTKKHRQQHDDTERLKKKNKLKINKKRKLNYDGSNLDDKEHYERTESSLFNYGNKTAQQELTKINKKKTKYDDNKNIMNHDKNKKKFSIKNSSMITHHHYNNHHHHHHSSSSSSILFNGDSSSSSSKLVKTSKMTHSLSSSSSSKTFSPHHLPSSPSTKSNLTHRRTSGSLSGHHPHLNYLSSPSHKHHYSPSSKHSVKPLKAKDNKKSAIVSMKQNIKKIKNEHNSKQINNNNKLPLLDHKHLVVGEKLKNKNYKIPKNKSATSSESNSQVAPHSFHYSSVSSFSSSSNMDDQTSSSSKNMANEVQTFAKAKKLIEQNEKLYPELLEERLADERKEISFEELFVQSNNGEYEALKQHLSTTQWTLEDRLSTVMQQESDLKLESKTFNSWIRNELHNSKYGSAIQRPTFESFHKHFQDRLDKIRKSIGFCCVPNVSKTSYLSEARRQYYQRKIYGNGNTGLPSSTHSNSHGLTFLSTDEDKDDDSNSSRELDKDYLSNPDRMTNFEILAMQHAFKAFPCEPEFRTTYPKLLRKQKDDGNFEYYLQKDDDYVQSTSPDSSKSSKYSGKPPTKKKSKQIRNKKNLPPNQKFSQEHNRYSTWYPSENYNLFQTFLSKAVFQIEHSNYEWLEHYLKTANDISINFLADSMFFHRDFRKVLQVALGIKLQQSTEQRATTSDDKNSLIIPGKRQRRSSSKALDSYDQLHGSQRKHIRSNGTTTDDKKCQRTSSSKSPSPLPGNSLQKSQMMLGSDTQLMTRTQAKMLYEVMCYNGDSNPASGQQSPLFKDDIAIKQHLLSPLLSVKFLSDLEKDIKQRQQMLYALKLMIKIIKECPSNNSALQSNISNHIIHSKKTTGKSASQQEKNRLTTKSVSRTNQFVQQTPAQIWNLSSGDNLSDIATSYVIDLEFRIRLSIVSTGGNSSPSSPSNDCCRYSRSSNVASSSMIKCEMKLRSRSNSSSSTCLEPVSPTIGDDQQNWPNEFVAKILKSKRSKRKHLDKDNDEKISDEEEPGILDNELKNNYQLKYLQWMIFKIQNYILPVSSINQSIMNDVLMVIIKDNHLSEMENSMIPSDFQLIDVHHQYLFKEKNISNKELIKFIRKIEQHFQLNKQNVEKRNIEDSSSATFSRWWFYQNPSISMDGDHFGGFISQSANLLSASLYHDIYQYANMISSLNEPENPQIDVKTIIISPNKTNSNGNKIYKKKV